MIKRQIFSIGFVALALLLVLSGVTSAQYEHVITDAEDDVDYVINQSWTYDVERPNVDIIRVEISEGGEGVIVSLTVKGEITDAPNIEYGIYFGDGEDSSYIVHYSDGTCTLFVDTAEGMEILEPEATGAGTSTLSVDISLEYLHNPDSLEFTEVMTWEYIDGESEYYWDTAYPDEEYYDDDDDDYLYDPDDTDDEDVPDPGDDDPDDPDDEIIAGFLSNYWWATFLIIIIVFALVLVIKRGKKEELIKEERLGQHTPPPTPPPMMEIEDKADASEFTERKNNLGRELKLFKEKEASEYIHTDDIEAAIRNNQLDRAEVLLIDKKKSRKRIKNIKARMTSLEENEASAYIHTDDIEEAIRNNQLDRAEKLLEDKKITLKKIQNIKQGMDSLQEKERMIDTRSIEGALEKGQLAKGEQLLSELKNNYKDYSNVIKKLNRLDAQQSNLASQLADKEIDREIYQDAVRKIDHAKRDLEEKLYELRKKVIYEDYQKPF